MGPRGHRTPERDRRRCDYPRIRPSSRSCGSRCPPGHASGSRIDGAGPDRARRRRLPRGGATRRAGRTRAARGEVRMLGDRRGARWPSVPSRRWSEESSPRSSSSCWPRSPRRPPPRTASRSPAAASPRRRTRAARASPTQVRMKATRARALPALPRRTGRSSTAQDDGALARARRARARPRTSRSRTRAATPSRSSPQSTGAAVATVALRARRGLRRVPGGATCRRPATPSKGATEFGRVGGHRRGPHALDGLPVLRRQLPLRRPWHPYGITAALPDCADNEGPQGTARAAAEHPQLRQPRAAAQHRRTTRRCPTSPRTTSPTRACTTAGSSACTRPACG